MVNEDTKKYFAAANTSDGFKSYFGDIFYSPRIKRRYVIKGGPGTGKSSFMKRAALFALSHGHRVEQYLCSSDTDSIDGVVIDSETALLDGTAPHVCEAVLPVLRDQIVDLASFLDREALGDACEEALLLCKEKAGAYSMAYSRLAAARGVALCMDELRARAVDERKMCSAAERLFRTHCRCSSEGEVRVCQVEAYGIKGRARLYTLESAATKKLLIKDYYGLGRRLLRELLRLAEWHRQECCVSFDPISPDVPTELYFPLSGVWIGYDEVRDSGSEGEGDVIINVKRFARPADIAHVRREYRALRGAYEALVGAVEMSMRTAGEIHARLERIYARGMDFPRLSEFCTQFIEELFS